MDEAQCAFVPPRSSSFSLIASPAWIAVIICRRDGSKDRPGSRLMICDVTYVYQRVRVAYILVV